MSEPLPLRPVKDNVLLKRVQDRGSIIEWVGETYGVTDRICQVAEVMGIGPAFPFEEGPWRDARFHVGDLVVFIQARVHDHFRWGSDDVLVCKAKGVVGVLRDGFLVENPDKRRYERQPL